MVIFDEKFHIILEVTYYQYVSVGMLNLTHSLCDISVYFTTFRYSGLSSLINGTSENTIQNLQAKQCRKNSWHEPINNVQSPNTTIQEHFHLHCVAVVKTIIICMCLYDILDHCCGLQRIRPLDIAALLLASLYLLSAEGSKKRQIFHIPLV